MTIWNLGMQGKNKPLRWLRLGSRFCILAILFLMQAVAVFSITPAAYAQEKQSSSTSVTNAIGTLTMTLDNASDRFVYGQSPTPTFTVTLVFAVRPTSNLFRTASVNMDSGESFGGTLNSTDGITFVTTVYTKYSTIRAGQRTATASFTDASTNTTIYSAPITFTINRAPVDFVCGIDTLVQYTPGQSVTVGMTTAFNPPYPIDWKDATYSVTFNGPITRSYSSLTLGTNNDVTVVAPSRIGNYTYTCTFSGTSLYLPESITVTNSLVQVSDEKALIGVTLYTNPTTLVAGHPADFYIVFPAAPGLPAPTGQITFYIGNTYYTSSYNLTDGTLSLHFNTIPPLQGITSINVTYWGDTHYAISHLKFSLTNPPIPNGSGSGGPQATATAGSGAGSATATASTTATDATGPATTNSTTPSAPAASIRSAGTSWIAWSGGLLAVLLLGGGVGGFFVLRRRNKVANAALESQFLQTPAASPGMLPPGNDMTFSNNNPLQ